MIGRTLGHFEVLEQIGAGAMGVVYRARDTKLGREVALKVLPDDFARDPERLGRFHQEARSLATISHPSIAAIHGIEEDQGTHFLVLELIPGSTLADALLRGPLPLADALSTCRQIGEALQAAHSRGIVHRDLKPSNIKVTPDGHVKLLDFGLAKALEDPGGAGRDTLLQATATQAGAIVGTPLYASPEQLRGGPVDARTDIWAFGCVLFEAIAGRFPFTGATIADVIGAILAREPDLGSLPAQTPEPVRDLIRRCLEKNPQQRPESALVAARALEGALASLPGMEPPAPRPALRSIQVTFAAGIEASPAWSPDGNDLVYTREVTGVRHLFRQPWKGGAAAQLTRGDHDDIMPAWAPDGRTIVFVRAREPKRMLQPGDVFGSFDAPADIWGLDLETGREDRLIENAYHPSFSPDGTLLAFDAAWAGTDRIWVAGRNGRNPRQVTTDTSEAVWHVRPRWSPDGDRIVFQNIERTKFDIRVVRVKDGALTWVTNDLLQDFTPCWTPDGRHIVFSSAYRGGGINIWRIPVAREGSPMGPTEPVTTGAGQDVDPAISPDGSRMAYAVLRQNADIWRLPVDPATGRATGAPECMIGGTREESRGAWSPDGSQIAFNSDRMGDMHLWLHDVEDGWDRQLTQGHGGDYQPNWSPDGRALVFFSSRDGHVNIWTTELERGTMRQLTHGSSVDVNPSYSPDGSRIAFQSDRNGRLEVWVMNADGTGLTQLTRVGVGGHVLRWTPDGRYMIFRCPGRKQVMRVSVEGGDPEPLPQTQGGAHISLSPDATRIMDVVAHKVLWVSPLTGDPPEPVFEFKEPEARIDYPVWSPNGDWVLFDRFQPQGGDIWVAGEF